MRHLRLPRPGRGGAGGLVPLIAAILLSLRVATWFDCPKVSLSGDLRLFFSLDVAGARYFYFLDEVDFGLASPYLFRLLNPLELATFILVRLGVRDPCIVEAIALYTISVLAFLSTYLMFRRLLGSMEASLVASLYLYTTPFMVIDREISAIVYIYVMLIVTLSTYTLLRALEGSHAAVLAYPVTLLLALSRYPNVRIFYITLYWQLVVLLYIYVYKWLEARYRGDAIELRLPLRPILSSMKRILFMALLTGIALAPIAAFTYYNMHIFTAQFSSINLQGKDPNTGIIDVFRMLYMWSFTGYVKSLNAYYVPYHTIYYTVSMIIVTLAFSLVLPVLGVLAGGAPRRARVFLALVLALLYTLVLGHKIYGDLYLWLVKVKVFAPFRNTYNWYYLVALTSSMLVGLLALRAQGWRRPWGILAVSCLVISLGVVSAFPLYTGSVATNWLDPGQGRGYNIPYQVYEEVDKVLDPTRWTVTMPPTGVYIVFKEGDMIWGLGNPYITFLSKPIVTGSGSEYMKSPYQAEIREYLKMAALGEPGWREVSTVWGIGGFILSKGIDNFKPQLLFKDAEYNTVKASIRGDARLQMSIGFVEVYKVDSYPMLYAADVVVSYKGGLKDMATAVREAGRAGMIALVNDTADIAQTTCGSGSIEWVKVSPVKYEGRIKCTGRMMIVLLMGYDDNWILRVDDGRVVNHVKVNHIMNGWLVDAVEGSSFTIEYRLHYTMMKVIILSTVLYTLAGLAYLAYHRYRGEA